MLNKYVWSNYLKAGGADVVEMFHQNLTRKYTKSYATEIRRMVSKYCPMNRVLDEIQTLLEQLYEYTTKEWEMKEMEDGQEESKNDDCTIGAVSEVDTIEGDLTYLVLDEVYENISELHERNKVKPTPQRIFGYFISALPWNTTIRAMMDPEYFVPYYFQYHFNVLEIIAEQFDIQLPTIPAKKDYEGRFYYYGDICKALNTFRKENDLSPYELCAFLYDFAPNYIGGMDCYIIKDLPEPRGAFFIGGSEKDVGLPDDPSAITIWQCNEDTRAGDMILMYFRTPDSAIDSVWRACSVGFIDPFFYYYRCTYIGRRTKINRVSQHMMKAEPLISKMPIIKKNMQGINGVELLPSEYNRLMDLAHSTLFHFQYEEGSNFGTIAREKDVEDKMIKPLLGKLGYTERDYTQQLYIEIGNHNHALIPDFVLLPNRSTGHASAFAIVEAKKTIPNEKFLEETKTQARSYANLLKTRYSIIAAKEKVWVTSEKDDYSKTIFEATWAELNDPDTYYQLEKMIGFH